MLSTGEHSASRKRRGRRRLGAASRGSDTTPTINPPSPYTNSGYPAAAAAKPHTACEVDHVSHGMTRRRSTVSEAPATDSLHTYNQTRQQYATATSAGHATGLVAESMVAEPVNVKRDVELVAESVSGIKRDFTPVASFLPHNRTLSEPAPASNNLLLPNSTATRCQSEPRIESAKMEIELAMEIDSFVSSFSACPDTVIPSTSSVLHRILEWEPFQPPWSEPGSTGTNLPSISAHFAYDRHLLLTFARDSNAFFSQCFHWHPFDSLTSLKLFPQELRLSACAFVSHLHIPPLHGSVSFTYYCQARRAVSAVLDTPSLETLKACTLLALLAQFKGQPNVAAIMHKKCMHQLAFLQLNEDPDFLPHLQNTSDALKNERRMLYWSTILCLKIYQTSNNNRSLENAGITETVKPAMTKIGSVLTLSATVCLCNLLDIVIEIVHFVQCVPQWHGDFVTAPDFTLLENKLVTFYASLHPTLQLPSLQKLDADLFVGPKCVRIALLNLFYCAAHCQLHRPNLQLTAYLQPAANANHQQDPSVHQEQHQITDALSKSFVLCHIHATKIAEINTLLRKNIKLNQPPVAIAFFNMYLPIFEAAVVLWFICCKSLPSWTTRLLESRIPEIPPTDSTTPHHQKIPATSQDLRNHRRMLSKRVSGLLKTLQLFETIASPRALKTSTTSPQNNASMVLESESESSYLLGNEEFWSWERRPVILRPLIECVEAMVYEMEALLRVHDSAAKMQDAANYGEETESDEELKHTPESQCRSTGTSDKTSGNTTEDDAPTDTPLRSLRTVILETQTLEGEYWNREPAAFMGLLGAEVFGSGARRYRWGGEFEDSWRRLWDRYSF
ncbi:hypothetical protein CcCBS67573_g07325 [Chytriomyces confervae]|uniref:Transcription factor domain-containing protein n=1 Tax=Chytriomyces confervae TaxID=246404 RepID=A0A507EXA3_9FUNG|nr:hypothetical protein CcCBS67573_g07325 [Chytriomyces confervae]